MLVEFIIVSAFIGLALVSPVLFVISAFAYLIKERFFKNGNGS